jgi:VanZ family protein
MAISMSTNPLARRIAGVIHAPQPWRWLLFVLVAVVCYLALAPVPPKDVDLRWDKLNHASAFTALTVAGCLGFPGSRRLVLRVLLGLLALGGLIEIVQYFVPGRSCEWFDLLADAAGIAIGLGLALIARAWARRGAPPPGR